MLSYNLVVRVCNYQAILKGYKVKYIFCYHNFPNIFSFIFKGCCIFDSSILATLHKHHANFWEGSSEDDKGPRAPSRPQNHHKSPSRSFNGTQEGLYKTEASKFRSICSQGDFWLPHPLFPTILAHNKLYYS